MDAIEGQADSPGHDAGHLNPIAPGEMVVVLQFQKEASREPILRPRTGELVDGTQECGRAPALSFEKFRHCVAQHVSYRAHGIAGVHEKEDTLTGAFRATPPGV
jgi:hypothetical protein